MNAPHFPPALLEQMLLGKLSAEQTDALCVEIERQGDSTQLPVAGMKKDVLLKAIQRACSQKVEVLPRVQHLIERLKAQQTRSSALDESQTGGYEPSTPEQYNHSQYLSPSQQPDELGRLGSYRVLKLLGQGGMGSVFLAEDTLLRRRVALKVMKPEIAANPDAKERFLREARSAAAIEHDNIIPIFQVGVENKVPFLAMPLLKGMPLDERIKNARGPLPLPEVLRIGREAADGLAAAHARGLIHRDIKPGNMWLEQREGGMPSRVKILDFGLARTEKENVNLTKSGAVVGTPAYMAPEQARGGGGIDSRADLFSLGVVLYQLATGKRPFTGDNTIAILTSLALDVPMPPERINPAVPEGLSQIIMQLLEKEPGRRPQSGRKVSELLRKIEIDMTMPIIEALPGAVPAVDPWEAIDASDTTAPITIATPSKAAKEPLSAKSAKKPSKKRGSPWPLVMGLAGLTAAIFLAVIIIVRDKNGEETARIVVPEGGAYKVVPDEPKGVVKPFAPLDETWLKKVAAMKPDAQAREVLAELARRNKGFDGKETHKIEGDFVTELEFLTDFVTDISPVRASRIYVCSK